MINLQFKLVDPQAMLPTKSYETDAGIDFYAIEDAIIPIGESLLISTGLAWAPVFDSSSYRSYEDKKVVDDMKVTHNIYMKIEARSGLSSKKNIEIGASIIDNDYRSEIKIHLYNHGKEDFEIKKGDKIAQGVVNTIPKIKITRIFGDLPVTARGANGFGSTDRK